MERNDFYKINQIIEGNGVNIADTLKIMGDFKKDDTKFSEKYEELRGKNPISLDDPKGRVEWHNAKHREIAQYFIKEYINPYNEEVELKKEAAEVVTLYNQHKQEVELERQAHIKEIGIELIYFPEMEMLESSNSMFMIEDKDGESFYKVTNVNEDDLAEIKKALAKNKPDFEILADIINQKSNYLEIDDTPLDRMVIPMDESKATEIYISRSGIYDFREGDYRKVCLQVEDEYFYVRVAPEYDVLKSDEQQKTTDIFEKIIVEKEPIELEKANIYNVINTVNEIEFLINETYRNNKAIIATDKDLLDVLECDFDMDKSDFEIKYVNIGYSNEENQKDGYFSNEYSLGADLYKIGDFYIVAAEVETNEYEFESFTSLDKATKKMEALENSGLRDIQDIIDDFIKEVDNDDIDVKVKETRNHGYFIEYQIMYKDFIMEDNIYELDAKATTKDINDFIEFEKELAENDLELVSCKKVKNNFDRGYEVTVKDANTHYTYESTQYIEGQQGISRSTLDYLQAAVVDMSIDIEKDREEEKQKSDTRGR